MRKVVMVTGSSGFLGTNFIRNSSEYSLQEVDLLKNKVSELNFSCCECVLHFAALVHKMKGAPKDQYFSVNRDLAFEVAIHAKAQGVKHFVFMSTAKVYGESTTGKNPWNENAFCHPTDPYGESKLQAEKLILSIEEDNFKVAVIRSPLIYGPEVRANMLNFIQLIENYPVLPLNGIYNKRSMVYVGNLVAMIKQIINTNASGIFIAGDQLPLSTTKLTLLIAKGLKKRIYLVKIPTILLTVLKFLKPSIADRIWGSLELDNSTSNNNLNFKPPYSTEIGIEAMVEWYLNEKNSRKE